MNCQGRGQAGDTEDAVGETQSNYHLNIILLCGVSVLKGSPEWQYARCCQGGNNG